ncbi:MAG: SPOR domain-containing protein [Prevotella sp.]
MIELDRHIEILLLDNDCVIVPNFGGFVAHHVESRYDESECSFLPPLRTLGFNPHLKNINDSLLVQSYVEAYDISYPEAQRTIANEVDQLKEQLDEMGHYELKNIGLLSINDAGDTVFEPCEAGILTPDLYGLCTFEMKRITDTATTVNAVKEENVKETPILPKPMGILPEKEAADEEAETTTALDDQSTECDEDTSEKTISIKVSWIRNIAVAAAAVIAFFLLSTPVTNSIDGTVYVSDMGTGLLTKITALDTPNNEKAKVASNIDDKIKKAVANRSEAKPDTTSKTKPTASSTVGDTLKKAPAYCIVLASQVTKNGAEDFIKRLQKEGLEKSYMYINNKVVRVVYGRYETEAEAYKDLRVVRGNKYFEQAWIYKMTH